jgi:hypothetical protein
MVQFKKTAHFERNRRTSETISFLATQHRGDCSITEPSGQSFLSERYDTAIFCFSKGLPFSSGVPHVPAIPFVPAKEAKNRPTLSMR